jgi:hypothetical protein
LIQGYLVLADRIRSEVTDLDKLVWRAERAVIGSRQNSEDQDLYIDSAALSLHDLYSGLERIFRHIAATVDNQVPSTQEWHRDLLHQMEKTLPGIRPAVISLDSVNALEEYLRFRHVVRNIYAFSLIPEQIERLVQQLKDDYATTQGELLSFADFLEQVGRD